MADPAAVPVQQPLSPAREIPVFEFTKRKRWADLLITELNDTVIFVLSETCQVWYCGNAVTELLGWRDDELVDADLIDLMNGASRVMRRKELRLLRLGWTLRSGRPGQLPRCVHGERALKDRDACVCAAAVQERVQRVEGLHVCAEGGALRDTWQATPPT